MNGIDGAVTEWKVAASPRIIDKLLYFGASPATSMATESSAFLASPSLHSRSSLNIVERHSLNICKDGDARNA
eukprot:CAMPEP_0119555792 /NCGR_PEP_ID=MMETSP1352-20130426/7895_1 /TAXON_ID=265584 /ORGANISM="Stauroneis constricta, Strain CCMP1120" /LENGTH=72 /DNA_ID=CAMNT_0007602619 /DNA_START=103 /DNA_END=318 /DNA_ORIENTATION=-